MGLFIDSPSFNEVDVHSIGEVKGESPGLWHCVPSKTCCSRALENELFPKKYENRTSFGLRCNLAGIKGKLILEESLVQIDVIKQDRKMFNKKRKGSNDLSDREISDSVLFKPSSTADVSIVIFHSEESKASVLVLMRIHNRSNTTNPKMSEMIQLYDYITQDGMLRHGGYDSARSAGSSGLTEFNNTMARFLNVPSNFPRKVTGVKLVKKQFYWKAFYMSPWQKRACTM